MLEEDEEEAEKKRLPQFRKTHGMEGTSVKWFEANGR